MDVNTIIAKPSARTAEKAVKILRKGGVIIYPTETVYGMGADVTNKKAVAKVFRIKKRKSEKKVIWAFSDVKMIKKHLRVTKEQESLIKKLMPGPFTLIVKDQAFRIPDNKITRTIIRKLSRPITTTSANPSGKKIVKVKNLVEVFGGKVDLIIDDGDKKGRPSTVFRWEDHKILRRGPITKKEIMSLINS